MHVVVRAITRPQDLTEHRHLHILQRIGQAIRDAPGTVHIWKVKSHIGIVGNEKADAAAVSVAKGESAATYTYATPSHDRRHIHWPHKTSTHHSKDGTATPAAAPLADMNASLKTIAHNNSKYGGAATDGIYSTAWRGVASQVNHKLSHLFLTHKDIGLKISKPVMQYRWGRLPTNNWLHKIGISPTNKCPLCGEVDGGHHVVSGCKAHQKAYVQRHNEAGTEILEAISKGTKGHCVMMSDVGFGKRRSPAENPEGMQPHRFVATATFPPHVGSALAAELHEYRASVPDILLIENDAGNCATHFNIVEIKYCRDTDPGPQREKAEQQHSELQALVKEKGLGLEIAYTTPLILGASGVIYNDFAANMETLGVTGPAMQSLARRLHLLAIRHLHKIWAQRNAMIRKSQPPTANRRYKPRHTGRKRARTRTAASKTSTKRPAPPVAPEHRKRRRTRGRRTYPIPNALGRRGYGGEAW
jgi:hypothetical protein